MDGREFVAELERHGFAVKRRCRSFVWIARGEQTLMLDEEAAVPDKFLRSVLEASSRPPPSARVRHSIVPTARHSVAPSSRHSVVPSSRHSIAPSTHASLRPGTATLRP